MDLRLALLPRARYAEIVDAPRIPPGFTVESGVHRDAQGRWFHEGQPVENPAVARAFDRWIDRADDGRYILRNSVNWAYAEIEGAPFFVRSVDVTAQGMNLHLSDESIVALAAETLRQDEGGKLFCDVRDGRFVAQFTRKATLQFEPLLGEDEQGLFVELGDQRVRPPVVAQPLLAQVGTPRE